MGFVVTLLALVAVGLAWQQGWIAPSLEWLKNNKDALGGLQAVITIVGALVGAWWAIRRFGWSREGFARANVDVAVTCKRLDATRTLVSVAVTIDNKGQRAVTVQDGWVQIRQVLPLAGAGGSLQAGRRRVDWPKLGEHEFVGGKIVASASPPGSVPPKLEATVASLDPGERDVLTFEFVIPAEVTVIKAWGHVKDPQTKLGYVFETLADVDKPRAPVGDTATVA